MTAGLTAGREAAATTAGAGRDAAATVDAAAGGVLPTMIGTDAGGLDPAWAAPLGPYHPRAYGSYARILGKYVREEKVLPLEEAIRKMSWAVASRLGLYERGRLHVGCYADVVVFDPATVIDKATFEQPHQLAVGVRDVWVNGRQVLANGRHTGATPGRIVDGPGQRMAG